MKTNNKYYALTFTCLALMSCSAMDEMVPEGSVVTQDQVVSTNEAVPDRVSADLAGVYTYACQQYTVTGTQAADCDYGYPSLCLSQDLNGPDMVCDNSGYHWFAPSSDYTDRQVNYIIAYQRYAVPYNQLKLANDVLASIDLETATGELRYFAGQAKAIRAFDYLALAPYFQFSYQTHKDAPCVPIVTEDTPDYANNGRATVEQVYTQIITDLTDAISLLEGFDRGTDKSKIDQQVAYGLRARAYLYMGLYAEAAADAEKALVGYTPYSIAEVSTPAFCKITDHNWMWGILIEPDNITGNGGYPSWPSHLCSFGSVSYTANTGVYKRINTLLYNQIPDTDVRKGWWIDANLDSPLLETISWNGVSGRDISTLQIPNTKTAFPAYTVVKFGMEAGVGSTDSSSDWPLMRAEEMILTQAEGLVMSGQAGQGKQVLENFVKTYRDPQYVCEASSAEDLQTEIWKQRRIELWGEGFSMADIMRLNKPVVRIQGNETANWPDAYAFNVAAGDEYFLLRFPQGETNTNLAVSPEQNNNGGSVPQPGQNSDLRDGVTN